MTDTAQSSLDLSGYRVTDDFFGAPYVDIDEVLDAPASHRYVHGGFEGTDTRFALRFPIDDSYAGRMFQPLEGANAGHEDVFAGALGSMMGGLEMTFRLGGYMVETNMGHIGDVKDPKAGDDPTIYGWRAAAESARFSKYVAAQILGAAPHHSYVWGGSGGARRSPLCLAYAPDAWDAAMPFMGDALDGEFGDWRRVRTVAQHFCAMFNVQRVLKHKIWDVIDAMLPGGSGNPFEGLDTHQREELATLYRLGYPRGDEFMIHQPMGQIWLWSSYAERLLNDYPEYWEAFWTKPGHIGFDAPQLVDDDLIDAHTTVVRAIYAKDLMEEERFQTPECAQLRGMAMLFAGMHNMWDTPMAVELADVPPGYVLGAGVRLTSGAAAGRQLYCLNGVDNVLLCDGEGEASNKRFSGVEPGDAVHFSNRQFLAYCYMHRHHSNAVEVDYASLRVDGVPIYPQYEIPEMSPFMATCHTGKFDGKMMWIHHTHDASLWPSQGIGMRNNVIRERGDQADDYFVLRWTQNAEHVPPQMAASPPGRDNRTWLVDYAPILEQCLADLAEWVEGGARPSESAFEYKDGKVTLPPTAAERGGIQPVLRVTANGSERAEVSPGSKVTLTVHAEVPPHAGTVVAVAWDLDGSGNYAVTQEVDGTQRTVELSITHTFDTPGTHFPTAIVHSHRGGDVNATSRRIPNLGSARVVVS
jgi:plastocyanin